MNVECAKKLRDILTRTGHVLAVEDFDDLAELDRLAGAVSDPAHGIDSPLVQHPVFVASVPVYPLTLAHLTYLDEAPGILGVDDDHRTLLMLWVVTKQRIIDEDYNPDTAKRDFCLWRRRSTWSPQDMEGVLQLRYESLLRKADGSAGKENHDGALVGMLAREYGDSPDYWMHVAPLGVIEACVADWMARQEAQASAYRKASGGKVAFAPEPSPKFTAMKLFRECAERIEAKWQRKAS